MDTLSFELRYVIRSLKKNRGFTFVVILTLALGIGANTSIFSLVDTVLLRPLPYQDPGKLLALYESIPQKGVSQLHASGPNFVDWKTSARSFDSMACYSDAFFNVSGSDYPERVSGANVSEEFFQTLGVEPVVGRIFLASEIRAGNQSVAVLSHSLWQRRFGGSLNVLREEVRIDGKATTIVGIMPTGFNFPAEAEVWMPNPAAPAELNRALNMFSVIGRLKTGTTLSEAQAEMDFIARRLEQQYRESNEGHRVEVLSLPDAITGRSRTPLLILLLAVGVLLLICCANVASLLLTRMATRQKELAVRVAIGAGTRQLTRQVVLESLLLAFSGGAAGLMVAFFSIQFLPVVSPDSLPRMNEVSMHFRETVFALFASILTATLFSWLPLRQIFKMDLQRILHSSAAGGIGRKTENSRRLLVISEIALACFLTAGAGLLITSFIQLLRVDPGFRQANILTLRLELPESQYPEDHQKVSFYSRLFHKIIQLPSVRDAAGINLLPTTGVFMQGLTIEGATIDNPANRPISAFRVVTPRYFATLGIPLLQGRVFSESDNNRSFPAAVVDEMTAKRYWPRQSPLGKRFSFEGAQGPWLTVVGVVGNVRYHGLHTKIFPTVYVAHSQTPFAGMMLAVHTSGDPLLVGSEIRRIVAQLNPDLPVYKMMTFEKMISNSLTGKRFPVILIGVFSGFALFLAILGVYGIVSFSIKQRTREIGIRRSVGATNRDILQLMIREGMTLTIAGLLLGTVFALYLKRFIATMIPTTSSSTTVGAFLIMSAIVLVFGLLASLIPARHALKIDPSLILRSE